MLQQWAIKAEKLTKVYPGLTAVNGFDMSVKVGEVHGFLGPNGAGKSTTLRMIGGLLRPTGGRVLVMGEDPVLNPAAVKGSLGLLPENTPLYQDMLVGEFLSFMARLRQVPTHQLASAVEHVLRLAHLTDVRHRLIGNLSKGYRQRVGIAQAMVHDPAVIVLDEPTAGLDPQSVMEIRELIRSLRGHKTVVFSSHVLHEVEAVCDSISIIHQGQLRAAGSLTEVRKAFQGRITVTVETELRVPEAVAAKLQELGPVEKIEVLDKRLVVSVVGQEEIRPALMRLLLQENVGVLGLHASQPELEDIFMAVTANQEQP